MAVPTQQSASAVSQRSVQRMREAIAGALSSSRSPFQAEQHDIPVDPGPNFPRAVPKIPGIQSIALGPSLDKKKQSEWHVVTPEGAAAVGEHHDLLDRTSAEEESLPEVVLVHGDPENVPHGEGLRIRLCNQDGEPTSLEDLELEEVPDVVPFVDNKTDSLSQLIEAWPRIDGSTQEAILMLVKAAAE